MKYKSTEHVVAVVVLQLLVTVVAALQLIFIVILDI